MSGSPVVWRSATCAELTYWLRRRPEDWLSPRELAELALWRDAGRRRQWLAGRAVAKQLLSDRLGRDGKDPAAIEVLSRGAAGGARPQVWIENEQQPVSLSLAHCESRAAAALAIGDALPVGIDLVPRTARLAPSPLWFHDDERAWMAEEQSPAGLIWGVKEASYKAANDGERFVPRRWIVARRSETSFECRSEERRRLVECECVGDAWVIVARCRSPVATPVVSAG